MVLFCLWSCESTHKMKKSLLFVLLFLFAELLFAATETDEIKFDKLPSPVTNNAITGLKHHGHLAIFSFMGIGQKKTWDAVTNAAYLLDTDGEKWTEVHPVPGTVGRIAAVAAAARDHVFLFGGYVLDGQGGGMTVPDVNIYEPSTNRWLRGADMPLPVGDAVAGVYRDRYIYILGGRSNSEVESVVQIYDAEKDTWMKGAAMPSPVFGHAGALLGESIIYVDGATKNPSAAKPLFTSTDECWLGKIDHHDLKVIHWSKLPAHPGAARFRIAAGAFEKDETIYFSGGSSTPYLFTGVGYDGNPAEPSAMTFAFNLHSEKWEVIDANTPNPTMDHRGLVVMPEGIVVAGGMEKGQQVTARVTIFPRQPKTK